MYSIVANFSQTSKIISVSKLIHLSSLEYFVEEHSLQNKILFFIEITINNKSNRADK